jgi:hypothetical protein
MRLWLVAALALALPAAASAEIFKCVGPNGEVRFTSNAGECPNATPHAPKADAVQRATKSAAPLATARPGAAASARRSAAPAAQDTGAEALWRGKRREAERAARVLEGEHDRVLAAVRWCNKGHGVVTENPRTGIRESVPCSAIAAERHRIESELAKARRYLESGLEEECRQAGCMPGWIR